MPRHFIKVDYANPHRVRRRKILATHPKVAKLYGYEPLTVYFILGILGLQLVSTYFAVQAPWWIFVLMLYFVGATLNHMLYFLIHECVHGLAAKKESTNLIYGILANLTIGIPIAVAFKKYHLDHHRYLGERLDTDVPLQKEAQWCNTRFKKWAWLLSYPLIYSIRPYLIEKKGQTHWELANIGIQLLFNVLVVLLLGWKALLYLMLSSLIGMSFHPLAAHFISEHFVAEPEQKQETYSYYGPWNWLAFNFGYHIEHHDFPRVPWSKLPAVYKAAPEFYKDQYTHSSWLLFVVRFLKGDEITLFSRVVREEETGKS